MTTLPENIIEKLIQIEEGIHYFESPELGQMPFVVIERESLVILSAPHGAMTFRNNHVETWHEEDEYTAGMALLLSEICNTSVIATTWRTEDSDPNEDDEDRSAYKRELRRLAQVVSARWVIDLHGAGEDSPRLFEKQPHRLPVVFAGLLMYCPVLCLSLRSYCHLIPSLFATFSASACVVSS